MFYNKYFREEKSRVHYMYHFIGSNLQKAKSTGYEKVAVWTDLFLWGIPFNKKVLSFLSILYAMLNQW